VRAVLVLVAVLVVAIVAAQAAAEAPARERCRAQVVYRGVKYNGLEASHLRLKFGLPAGTALEPQCVDTPPFPPKTQYRPVAVRKVVGIRARVAIARRDVPNLIYVAVDRCRNTATRAAFVRCLRTSR
jgi:hypothetical protein